MHRTLCARIVKGKLFCGIIIIILLFLLLHPDMNARRSYSYIEKDLILVNLHKEVAKNFTTTAVVECDYEKVIFDDTTFSPSLVDGDLIEDHRIIDGGEYTPSECRPLYSTAIIVPYRDRAEQLHGFLIYMHTFLRRQHLHYRIYVVEQVDTHPFNRAKLLNVGALAAMRAGYPCLVLHDVDLLPLRPANLYACTKQPRHMSSSINKFRWPQNKDSSSCYYILAIICSLRTSKGAIAIVSKQFKDINGMSNEYFGWGGEDDDLYSRLEAQNLKLCRFEPRTSIYHMLSHMSQEQGNTRNSRLTLTKKRMVDDGLNTLHYTEVVTVLHPLFTHVVVDL